MYKLADLGEPHEITFGRDFVHDHIKAQTKIAELDAEFNGGALVEVARVMGKPLYMRVDHHDPERAKHDLAEMQSIVKSVVIGED